MFLKGFGLDNCEKDVAKQPSKAHWVRQMLKGYCEAITPTDTLGLF